MKYIEKFKFRLDDMNLKGKLKNESILKILESVAGYHSDLVGYGYCDTNSKKVGWVLLEWKVEVKKRPAYQEELTVKTWGRKMVKCYTYRDFEIQNQKGETCIIASSKWTLIDLEKGKLARLTPNIIECYQPEDISVFEEDFDKLQEPKQTKIEVDYKIRKNEIDNNRHVHNTCYLNMAYEALPEEIFFQGELDHLRISYKKEIKYGETVECHYAFEEQKHIITIVRKEDKAIHAIVQMW